MNTNKPPGKTITAHANPPLRRHCEAREKTCFLENHCLPKQTSNGEEYYCPLTLQHLEAHHKRLLGPGSSDVVFTKKEMQVLELICQEFSDKEIAARTGTSRRTVETHKRNIRAKTKSYNNVGCINYARSQGIIFLQLLWVLLNSFADSIY